MAKKILNLLGQKFHYLTPTEIVKRKHKTHYKCICDCGNTTIVSGTHLTSGHTKSCGCYRSEANSTHGLSWIENKTPRLYEIWSDMKQRCYNKNIALYKWYGAKGVVVCDEWKDNYTAFHDWAILNGYNDNLTIDRHPNKTGNYSPGNCRWATKKEQGNNRINSRLLTYNGRTQTLKQWAEELNMCAKTIQCRLDKSGWSIEKALTTPAKIIFNENELVTAN